VKLRAIALSGYGMASDVKKSLDAGFDDHVTKPVNFSQLLEAIAGVTASPPLPRRPGRTTTESW
jgi:CheY-like chemotaxis protein